MIDVAYRLYNNKYSIAVRRGMLRVLPLILINSLFHIVIALLSSISLEWVPISFLSVSSINNLIASLIEPLSVITISYSLVQLNNERNHEHIPPLITAPLALIIVSLLKDEFYNSALFGEVNVVVSLIVTIIIVEIYSVIFRKFKQKHFNQNIGYDLTVTNSFLSVIPITLTVVLSCFMCILLKMSEPFIMILLRPFMQLESFILKFPTIDYLVTVIREQFIWFFGGYGEDVIQLDLVHKSCMHVFSQIGGAGATLGLILAILVTKSNSYYKNIAKLSFIPAFFYINEPMIFGIPIIFNPIYFIPFIFTPVILNLVTRFMVNIGFLTPTVRTLGWSIPLIEDGYLIGGVNGILVQCLNVIIATLIYLPFVHLGEDIRSKLGEKAYGELKDEVFNLKPPKRFLTIKDNDIGFISRTIGKDLMRDLKEKTSNIYVEYQPQVNQDGKVVGVEALLRYKHEKLGNIPPNIVVMIAEELNLIFELGAFVFNQACEDLANWNKVLKEPIDMSVNVSTYQVRDPKFYRLVKHGIQLNELDSEHVKLEITETLALGDDEFTKKQLKYLSDYHVRLVIDDFGPGYNPILYIKKYNIHELKLDGSLVRDIETNKVSQDIIRAMYDLCNYSNLILVAEFVETESQKAALQAIGPMIYQGYLYSKPISADETLAFIKKNWEKLT